MRFCLSAFTLLFAVQCLGSDLADDIRSGIERANHDGAALVTLSGRYDVEETIAISSHQSTEFPRLDGALTIDARGAFIDVTADVGFLFEGTSKWHGRNARVIWDGGRVGCHQNIAFRCLDLMSSTISPYSIERADVAIQVGILRSWSENCGYGGLAGREMYGRRCRRILEFYGRAQTWELLGTKPNDALTRRLKYESFAGTTVSDIVIAGAIDPTVDGQLIYASSAAIYRSSIFRLRGNTPNGGGSLIWTDCPYWRATTIRDIAVETANKRDKPRSVAIRFARPLTAKPDAIESVWWMGGEADAIETNVAAY
ncbi:MAG: hypothetical protein AAFX06_28790 [Planctomycetota bacterium]